MGRVTFIVPVMFRATAFTIIGKGSSRKGGRCISPLFGIIQRKYISIALFLFKENMNNKITIFIAIILIIGSPASASTIDCQNLYIGRIWVEKGAGLKAVVYLNERTDSSGSYWSYFTGWSAEDKKEVLTLLVAAKASGHRVNVETTNADGCGLQAGGTTTQAMFLTTQP